MREYDGLKDDNISGGGKFVKRKGYGHEMFNFRPYQGRMYGYVDPVHRKGHPSTIHIERLDPTASDKVDGILVIWTARRDDKGGTFIVGWYKNATVFRHKQAAPSGSNRIFNGEHLGYQVTAD